MRNKLYIIIVLVILVFAVLSDYIWIKGNDSINGVDSQNHLFFSINFFYDFSDIVTQGTFSLWEKAWKSMELLTRPVKHSCFYWPNGLNFSASFFYFLFGPKLISAKLTLLPYLLILLISTYLIGKTLYGRLAGIMAMFILFMYPLIFESFRQFQLDSPLTAMVALSMLTLIKSDYFKDRKYSVFFGIAFGWAMLIKGQSVLFITWPFLLVLYKVVMPMEEGPPTNTSKANQFLNIAISLILASFLASIWWWNQRIQIMPGLNEHILDSSKALESWWDFDKKYSIESISHHLRRLYFSLGLIHFLLFFVSLIFFIKGNSRYKGFFLIWILVPFILFSSIFTVKHQRFLMPILPALAIVTAWGLSRIRNVKLKISLLIAVLFYSLAQFYLLYDISKNRISLDKDHIFFGHTGYRINSVFIHPDKEISDIADVMCKNRNTRDVVKVGFISCTGRPETFELLFWSRIINKSIDPYDFIETGDLFLEKFKVLDFIVLALPLDSSISFPTVGFSGLMEFLKESHGERIRDIEKSNVELLNRLAGALKDASELFFIEEKIKGCEKAYYIYKRKEKM